MPRPIIYGVIPARSGSKGIPGKNIRPFLGKPLLAWAIESALESKVFDKVILYTDSPEYADIGKKHGAEVPWLEPAEHASDTSDVFHAFKWLVNKFIENGERPDYIARLEPTAPARHPEHIRALADLVFNTGADAAFTVFPVPSGHNAHWQYTIDSENKATIVVNNVPAKHVIRRRQQLPPTYMRGGSTYISKTECLLKDEPDMFGDDTRVHVIDPKYSIDLDTEEDFKEAERLVALLRQEGMI
jgi:CMP-N,N'-diacetyllegionaminic acid synthase